MVLASCGGGGDSPPPPATLSAAADAATVAWNSPATVDVLANDTVSRGAAEIAAITSPPAHGVVVVASGKAVYTPAAGYFGEDRFTYSARASEGGATSSAEVRLTVQATLKLEGRVGHQAMAGASVSVTVGDRSTLVTADATGAYAASLTTSNPADMVTLVATGTGSRSKLKVSGLAGDAATLARLADGQGVLRSSRVPSINVSPLSSAVAVLVTQANGGKAPADAATWQAGMFGLPPQRVIDLATVIDMIADQTIELPAASADTLALIQQPATPEYRALLTTEIDTGTYRWDRYVAARAKLASSAVISGAPAIAATAAEDRAYVAAFRAASPPGAVFVSYRPDGTATLATANGARTGTWQITEGTIRITLDAVLSSTWYDVDSSSFEPINFRDDVSGYVIRQFAGGARAGMAVVAQTGTTVTLDGPKAGTRQPIADSGTVVSAIDPSLATALSAADFAVGSRWAGVILDTGFTDYAYSADTLEIQGGSSARYLRTGSTAAWAVEGGWLRLVQGSADRRYLRLSRPAASGEEHWLVADFEAGKIQRASEVMVIKAAALKFTDPAELHRRWQPGIDSLGAPWVNYFFDMLPAGKVRLVNVVAYGDEFGSDGIWAIEPDGMLGMTAYTSSGAVSNVRTWSLVARTATQLYVMEQLRYGTSSEIWRLNVYTDAGAAAPR